MDLRQDVVILCAADSSIAVKIVVHSSTKQFPIDAPVFTILTQVLPSAAHELSHLLDLV